MADGWGSFLRYPKTKMDQLEKLGANIKKYNPLRFGINTYINYRDHRKIVVIDGKVAVTGGINIGDEYINKINRFGYWMDCAVIIKGDAVKSFLAMFCSTWEFTTKKPIKIAKKIKCLFV